MSHMGRIYIERAETADGGDIACGLLNGLALATVLWGLAFLAARATGVL